MADALGAGFRQSVWMLADELGFDLDPQLRTTHETAVATAPVDSPIGPIAPGRVAAQRFRWEGLVDGRPVISAAVNWLMGEADLDPPWSFGPRASASRSRSPATPAPSSRSRACTPPRSKPAWPATPASWPRPCTASTPSPTSAPRPPASSPTWTSPQ